MKLLKKIVFSALLYPTLAIGQFVDLQHNVQGTLLQPNGGTGNTLGQTQIGTLGFTDTNIFGWIQASANSYIQFVIQNTNSGAVASSDYIVTNNNGTATTFYGDFGMNSSGFTGSGAFNTPNSVYVTSTSGDLALGTTTANGIHFVVNGGATDAATISSSGVLTANGGTVISSVTALSGAVTGTPSSSNFLRGDGTWSSPSGSGTVTSVSVVSANGFAGSVATATSTPAITLTTSASGVLKGSSSALVAATAGTDFVSPSVAATYSAAQTYPSSDLLLKGSSTGTTALNSANASATNFTATFPGATGNVLESVTAVAPVTGTPSSSNFLRGDGTWATPSGSGNVSGPGSSTNGFIPTWSGTTGTALATGYNVSGSGNVSLTTSPILTTPLVTGSSTGNTTLTSANASATNYTATLPANTGTIAELNAAQTFTSAQTFPAAGVLITGSSTGTTALTTANASATNYTVTMPIGNGNNLESASAVPVVTGTPSSTTYLRGDGTWSTPSGSAGSLTLVSTQTASSSPSLQWTALGTTYTSYMLVINNLVPATTATGVYVQIGEGGTPTWQVAASSYAFDGTRSAGTGITGLGIGYLLTGTSGSTNWVNQGDCTIYIHNIGNTGIFTTFTSNCSFMPTTTTVVSATLAGTFIGDTTTAKTAIRIIPVSGNIASGSASLYSISN